MLDKIDSPTEYINAISKLLPYSVGKIKAYEEIEERECRDIKITFVDTEGEEDVTTLQQVFSKKGQKFIHLSEKVFNYLGG